MPFVGVRAPPPARQGALGPTRRPAVGVVEAVPSRVLPEGGDVGVGSHGRSCGHQRDRQGTDHPPCGAGVGSGGELRGGGVTPVRPKLAKMSRSPISEGNTSCDGRFERIFSHRKTSSKSCKSPHGRLACLQICILRISAARCKRQKANFMGQVCM